MNWALVGYGGMGRWHVNKLRSMPEVNICGVYDIDSAQRQAAEENGLRAYASLDELLKDSAVQLLTLAVPNDCHKPIAVAAMRSGKNVICEKPVALSSGELQEMIDASQETGMLFTVHQNRRWDEDFLIMKKIYDENMLGRVFTIESRVHGSRGVPGDWRNKKRRGGGMILDWGVHLLDQLLQMVPYDVVSVFCTVSNVTNDEVDDGFHAVLTFADGLTVIAEVGTNNFIQLPRWYMLGENGSAVIRNWQLDGEIVKVFDWEHRDAVPVDTAAGFTKTMAPRTAETVQTYPLPTVTADVRDFYRNVFAAVEKGDRQQITHAQMMRTIRLMEALAHSAANNAVVHSRI
jgi:scyllo-inositol 2-dehydrogenase (NADP+)